MAERASALRGAGFRALTPNVKPRRGGVNTGRRVRSCPARSARRRNAALRAEDRARIQTIIKSMGQDQRRSSKPRRDRLLFGAEIGAQKIAYSGRSVGDFDLRANGRDAKRCQRVRIRPDIEDVADRPQPTACAAHSPPWRGSLRPRPNSIQRASARRRDACGWMVFARRLGNVGHRPDVDFNCQAATRRLRCERGKDGLLGLGVPASRG